MSNDFAIGITATDEATATIQKVNQALARLSGSTAAVQKGTKALGSQSVSSLTKLEESFKKVERSASLVVDKIVAIVPGLAAIGGMAGIGAVAEKFATFGQKLNSNARLVGMNTRELMKYEYAARRAGQSSESIVSTLGNMQGKIRSAALGQSPEAMAQLLGWGVNLKRDSHGSVTNMNDVVLQVMDKINRIPTAAGQSYAAGIFGASGSLPMIQQGTYRSDMDRASKPGFLPSDADIAKADLLNKKIVDMGQAFDTLKTKMGGAEEPIVGPIVDSITKMLTSQNGTVAAQLALAFTGMFSVISAVKIGALTAKLFGLGGKAKEVADTAEAAAGGLGKVSSALSAISGMAALGFAGYAAESGRAAALDRSIHQLPGETKDQRDQRVAEAIAGGATTPDVAAPKDGGLGGRFYRWLAGKPAAAATAATAPVADAAAQGAGANLPLGIRTNNPTNMEPDGRQAIYASAEDGIAAATYNLRKNYRGLTLTQIADKWTGGARAGNSAAQRANYLSLLKQGTGLGADAVPDLNNQQLVAAMLTRQVQAENGTNGGKPWYTPDQITDGVAHGFAGRPAMVGTEDIGSTPRGMNVTMTFNNVPKGTSVEAKTDDGAWMPTRINYSLTN